MNRFLIGLIACVSTVNIYASSPEIATALKKLCDGQDVKVVAISGSRASIFPQEGSISYYNSIVGFNTTNGEEKTIIDTIIGVFRPLICYSGDRIIYSVGTGDDTYSVYCVNWDGTGNRKITDGIAGCLWYDTLNNKEYIIYGNAKSMLTKCFILKKNIDNPTEKEDTLLDWTTRQIKFSPAIMSISKDFKYLQVGTQRQDNTEGVNQIFSLDSKQLRGANGGCWGTTPYTTPESSNPVYWTFSYNQTHTKFEAKNTGSFAGEVNLHFTDANSGEDYFYFGNGKFSTYDYQYYATATGYDDPGAVNTANKIAVIKMKNDYSAIEGGVVVMNSNCAMPDVWVYKGMQTNSTIKISIPHAGDTVIIGDTLNVAWDNNTLVDSVMILAQYNTDKILTLTTKMKNTGTFSYRIPLSFQLSSSPCRIIISGSSNGISVSDTSDFFHIVPSSTITIHTMKNRSVTTEYNYCQFELISLTGVCVSRGKWDEKIGISESTNKNIPHGMHILKLSDLKNNIKTIKFINN